MCRDMVLVRAESDPARRAGIANWEPSSGSDQIGRSMLGECADVGTEAGDGELQHPVGGRVDDALVHE